ncbi:hypothetical protein [Ascidiaceihabitans sp.]|uniref:hypothetical protein n=1 Tax=Ascidiaceihabitans sp. TaxID=1872644 RepID=UPI003297E6A1
MILEDIVAENTDIISRFADNGLNLNLKREFTFSVVLDSKEECESLRSDLRTEGKLRDLCVKQKLESGAFIVSSGPKDEQPELVYMIDMQPKVEVISEIELILLYASRSYPDAEVFWEFKE